MLRVGDWCVNPASGKISRNGEIVRVEVRTMRVLVDLAEHAGEVVSIDDLLNEVWSGANVSPDSVYQAVASLRRSLGDDPKQPTYIATVPRLGYRMVAPVSPWVEQAATADATMATPRLGAWALWVGIAVCAAIAGGFLFYSKGAGTPQPAKSIAVLPFLDLTDAMNHEAFADGMTEELIDKLSQIPGLRVPSATSSFYFKNKKMTVAEIAKALGVAYVLDGSIRRSKASVRVAARLVRAENGFVVWSETYDRPTDDSFRLQDEIAGEVTQALRGSIE
jgi:TolB-like protein/DNA-binding winged helix-turn-helix (wHTH) protein